MQSSPQIPSLEALRQLAASHGVEPAEEDLRAARGFLETILPALAELERVVPPGTVPAGLFAPGGTQ